VFVDAEEEVDVCSDGLEDGETPGQGTYDEVLVVGLPCQGMYEEVAMGGEECRTTSRIDDGDGVWSIDLGDEGVLVGAEGDPGHGIYAGIWAEYDYSRRCMSECKKRRKEMRKEREKRIGRALSVNPTCSTAPR
jgi:hypothetical protein